MFILEYKLRGKESQFRAIDEAIRTVQFVRNKCLRYWEDHKGVGQKDIYKHVTAISHAKGDRERAPRLRPKRLGRFNLYFGW